MRRGSVTPRAHPPLKSYSVLYLAFVLQVQVRPGCRLQAAVAGQRATFSQFSTSCSSHMDVAFKRVCQISAIEILAIWPAAAVPGCQDRRPGYDALRPGRGRFAAPPGPPLRGPCGGIGRRDRLKICFPQGSARSSRARGTIPRPCQRFIPPAAAYGSTVMAPPRAAASAAGHIPDGHETARPDPIA